MTVEELIDILLDMPPDLEVIYPFDGTVIVVSDVDEGTDHVMVS